MPAQKASPAPTVRFGFTRGGGRADVPHGPTARVGLDPSVTTNVPPIPKRSRARRGSSSTRSIARSSVLTFTTCASRKTDRIARGIPRRVRQARGLALTSTLSLPPPSLTRRPSAR